MQRTHKKTSAGIAHKWKNITATGVVVTGGSVVAATVIWPRLHGDVKQDMSDFGEALSKGLHGLEDMFENALSSAWHAAPSAGDIRSEFGDTVGGVQNVAFALLAVGLGAFIIYEVAK